MDILFLIIAILVGFILGGVINALADDLPFTLRVRLPHYPDSKVTQEQIAELEAANPETNDKEEWEYHVFDGEPRPRIAWFGTLAFLTGHRTAPTGNQLKLSWRQPIVEIVTALLFAYIAILNQPIAVKIYWMGCAAILILITVIDLEHRLILFAVIIPACLYAIIGAALVNEQIAAQIWFRDYLIGGLAGFGVFFILYLGGLLFSKIVADSRGEPLDEVAFGYGDVMLATLSGFMLGWQALIFAIFIAVFAGAAGAILYLVARLFMKGKYELYTALPYGQYIVFGTIIMMLWRDPVVRSIEGR